MPRYFRRWKQSTVGDFVKGLFESRTYEDMPLPIACGQTISQPSVVGLMTQALKGAATRQGFGGRHRLWLSGRDPVATGAPRLYCGPFQPSGPRGFRDLSQARSEQCHRLYRRWQPWSCPTKPRLTVSSLPQPPRIPPAPSWRS